MTRSEAYTKLAEQYEAKAETKRVAGAPPAVIKRYEEIAAGYRRNAELPEPVRMEQSPERIPQWYIDRFGAD